MIISNFSFECVSQVLFYLLSSKINAANRHNRTACKARKHEELHLKGDISWGADVQFKNEALMATRLANFISAFLQVVDPKEVFPGTRVVDKPLTEDQMIGKSFSFIYICLDILPCLDSNNQCFNFLFNYRRSCCIGHGRYSNMVCWNLLGPKQVS